VRLRWGRTLTWRAVAWGGAVSCCMAAGIAVPARARQYHGGLQTMRWDPDRAAALAGVRHALVLVRESWGAQLLARLWALGVTRSEAEFLYANLDQCELETALTWAEARHQSAAGLIEHLAPALADQRRLDRSPYSPDPTARYLPGRPYSLICKARQWEDQQGFTLFPPLLLSRSDNLYLRDLHGRDSLLLQALPDRAVYLLKPATSAEAVSPSFYLVSRDSLRAVWLKESQAMAQASP
ncbi:MAG: hypothetical protein ABJC74_05210, partial [Gemmatimonadota bacterium]